MWVGLHTSTQVPRENTHWRVVAAASFALLAPPAPAASCDGPDDDDRVAPGYRLGGAVGLGSILGQARPGAFGRAHPLHTSPIMHQRKRTRGASGRGVTLLLYCSSVALPGAAMAPAPACWPVGMRGMCRCA